MSDIYATNLVNCTLAEFAVLVREHRRAPGAREILEVHLHHSWRPTQAGFEAAARRYGDRIAAGRALVAAMRRDHVTVRNFSDIAQHVTIDPDGVIWLGRNWNLPPASARGFNGNRKAGPFMIEMIGDFDTGRETPAEAQREAAIGVIASVQQAWGLAPDRLRFHNEVSAKSCPGTSQNKDDWIRDVSGSPHHTVRATCTATGPAKAGPLPGGRSVSASGQLAVNADALQVIAAPDETARTVVENDGELPEQEMSLEDQLRLSDEALAGLEEDWEHGPRSLSVGGSLDPILFARLRPHVINLERGRFEGSFADDRFWSSEETVRQLLLGDFASWARTMQASGVPPRLMIWAHGGLVSEKSALKFAARDLDAWKANGVWPVFFVWETGAFEILAQERQKREQARARGWITDGIWEEVARKFGSRLWNGMKASAFEANDPSGGATFTIKTLAETLALLAKNTNDVELHLVGHSAGAIFLTYFWRNLLDNAIVPKTVQFLAPAVRLDVFAPYILNHPQSGLLDKKPPTSFRLFAMTDALERRDWTMNKVGYGRSILYAVSESFESGRPARLLGMERHVRADAELSKLFGLADKPGRAKAIFSVTSGAPDHEASNARTHGFDNDDATIHAVALHIIGQTDRNRLAPFDRRKSADFAEETVPSPEGKRTSAGPRLTPEGWMVDEPVPTAQANAPAPQAWPSSGHAASSGGARKALCIGIDEYEGSIARLGGCVNDAKAWGRLFEQKGYAVQYLPNAQASRCGMMQEIERFLRGSRAGDILTLQYAGHGTFFADEDGDEASGEDQAFVPVDADRNGCLLDDELYELVKANLPSGVRLIGFFDCCHSGSITRLAAARAMTGGDVRARFAKPTERMQAWYKGLRRRSMVRNQPTFLSFSACKDSEVALESNGAGHFTSVAVSLLQQGRDLTGIRLFQEIRREFRARGFTTQNPRIDGPPELFDERLPF